MNFPLNCVSPNVVYLMGCKECGVLYVGSFSCCLHLGLITTRRAIVSLSGTLRVYLG